MSTPEVPGERVECIGTEITYRPKLVPLTEGLDRLGISRATSYRLIARDEFPVDLIRVGRRWFMRTSDLDALTRAAT